MKKTLTLVLILALLFTTLSGTVLAVKKFSDLGTGHWAYKNVQKLVELGIIEGYNDGRFGTSDEVRVDQFIKMTVTALGYFPDESKVGYWATNYINKAIELKIIDENQFKNYRRAIKREEMAYIIVKAYQMNNVTSQDQLKRELIPFIKDYAVIDDSYKDYILTSYKVGLIAGKGKNGGDGFDPKGYATRAEASTVIVRLLYKESRVPFNFGDLPFTYISSGDLDDDMNWVETDLKVYAPTNQRGEAVKEVLTLHDKIKKIEKQDYGWFRIGYNRHEQTINTQFYPDIETSKLSAFEKIPHKDMSFTIYTQDFIEGYYPYTLVVWKRGEHHEDMGSYYSYLQDRYGEFLNIYATTLFEDEADKFISLFKEALNMKDLGHRIDDYYTINNRKVNISFGGSSGTISVSDKLK